MLLNAAEGTLNKLKSILDAAPTHCFNTSKIANDGGSNSVFYVNIVEPIPVWHIFKNVKHPHLTEMESINLWMWVGRKRPSKNPLLYIPGRTIIFDDFNKALLHVGIKNWIPGPPRRPRPRRPRWRRGPRSPRSPPSRGSARRRASAPTPSRNFEKAEAMVLLVKNLSKNYDSVVFRQHLDLSLACKKPSDHYHHCCKEGTRLVQEMVALNGWNDTQCPGHRNLSWDTGSCDCLFTRYC